MELPGLKSVASATVAPSSMSLRAGAFLSCMRKKGTAGRSVATVELSESFFIPSSVSGEILPFVVGGVLNFSADVKKSRELKYASCAVLQASLTTFIYISLLKA